MDSDNRISLKELLVILWDGRLMVAVSTFITALVSIFIALSLSNQYTAVAVLAPTENSAGGLGGLVKQYGALANMAGISLPSDEEGSKAQLAMQVMTSRIFIGDFVERRQLLPELMASQSWDLDTRQIIFNTDDYDPSSGEWIREEVPPYGSEPSRLEAHEQFIDILEVAEDPETGFVTISITHESPDIASNWVNWIIEDVNAVVKDQDVDEAKRSIKYLEEQIDKTALAELQSVFFDLIQSQTETIMLAQARPEYVFKTIDPAVPPEEKSGPMRAVICVALTLVGFFLGCFLVLLRRTF